MKRNLIFIFSAILSTTSFAQSTSIEPIQLSERFLDCIREKQDTQEIVEIYAALNAEELAKTLDTQEKKLTFWMNTYNAFIQDLLMKNPSLYDDRGAFFGKERMNIAGISMSFDDLEHGIIRSSRWKLSLGYLRNPFVPKHIRMWRTDEPDGRVHFALNCGAISCPPVRIYHLSTLYDQMDASSEIYLKRTTKIEGEDVTVTPLMSWFRGDFGGKKGAIKNYLKKYEVIDQDLDPELSFADYDWTLSLSEIID
jgi:hypothetical protein